MRSIVFLSLLIFPLFAYSQADDCADESAKKLLKAVKTSAEETCPNPKKIRHICMFIDGRSVDTEPNTPYRFRYQRYIHEAACVKPGDKEEVRLKKIQNMWTTFESQLICNNVQFDVPNGSVIKYAVSSQFDEFIWDIIYWKVNLNKVDQTDGKTVLDYLKGEIDRRREDSTERLKAYYEMLREAGAKHKSEL